MKDPEISYRRQCLHQNHDIFYMRSRQVNACSRASLMVFVTFSTPNLSERTVYIEDGGNFALSIIFLENSYSIRWTRYTARNIKRHTNQRKAPTTRFRTSPAQLFKIKTLANRHSPTT